MLTQEKSTLKVAVVEDSFSAREYRGENLEYNITPLTTLSELKEALRTVSPDLVILGENSNSYEIALQLREQYTLLLAVDEPEIMKWRKAIASGIRGVVQKPVSYDRIVAALKNVPHEEDDEVGNAIFIEAPDTPLPRGARVKRDVPKKVIPVEEIRKEVRPSISLVSKEGTGKLVTFYNTKGGVGKTLFSVNAAAHIAKLYPSKKVALVDFDLDFGDVANFLGIEPKITALSWQYIPEENLKDVNIENYLIKHSTGIWVLPAPIPPIDEDIFTHNIATRILSTLKKHFDLVVVDLGPTLRDVIVVTLDHADHVFLVSTTNIASLRNAYDLVRIFDGLKVSPGKVKLLLNAFKKNVDLQEVKKYIPYDVPLIVPYIKQVEELHNNYSLAVNDKRFRVYLEDLAHIIMGKKPVEKGFFSFLRRM